ncbi:hypothetical protein DL991_09955 [Amycolatopsis sp. WAC 01375]|uniref:hypothetical protein n=1 Tax=unclassified Amycolatopsis TaxID=2618356 RepID=UPI000F78E0D0|nr:MULTISPECIES: hypothetical protein [unclassified Amycolatopsis]RSM80763.1 hypothetical protein DL991_09955 [Amycolatopsis sp. WAC 01375]RSN34629.1 hypothetical protein DL990_13385 [Amycolatopsis sp. WAC 01416]
MALADRRPAPHQALDPADQLPTGRPWCFTRAADPVELRLTPFEQRIATLAARGHTADAIGARARATGAEITSDLVDILRKLHDLPCDQPPVELAVKRVYLP